MKFDDLINLLESQEELKIEKTFWDEAKTKPREFFYKNSDNKNHRLDGPAVQGWYKDGQKAYEYWYNNHKQHRLDGPAVQRWCKDGQIESELWLKDDNLHRMDGPAYQRWNRYGQKESESWFINGVEYTKEEFDEYVKGLESKEDLDMLGDLGQTFE